MARTIGDVALGHSILKGPDGIDGYAIHARDAEPDSDRVTGQPIRVAWVSDAAFGPVDPRSPPPSPRPPPSLPTSDTRLKRRRYHSLVTRSER
jgi:hypothetical protein